MNLINFILKLVKIILNIFKNLFILLILDLLNLIIIVLLIFDYLNLIFIIKIMKFLE